MKYNGPRVTDKETFVKKAQFHHGDKYDYSRSEYVNKDTKVEIICPYHGPFWQRGSSHSQGKGCRACKYVLHTKQTSSNTEEYIRKCQDVHGDRYSYAKVEYKTSKDKVIVKCRIHGDFSQVAGNHLAGQGCPKCGKISMADKFRMTTAEFIAKAKDVHGDTYDYSLVEYKNNRQGKVKIICAYHGTFEQIAGTHLGGHGCIQCGLGRAQESHRYSTEEFVDKAEQVHGVRYDYNHVVYQNSLTAVEIGCEEHGTFSQPPVSHLAGQGCPKCGHARKGFGRSPLYRSSTELSNIYVIELRGQDEVFIKVGLARKMNIRHSRIEKESPYSVKLLKSYEDVGRKVFDAEKKIKRCKSLDKYYPDFSFQGYTECFEQSSLDEIIKILDEEFGLCTQS